MNETEILKRNVQDLQEQLQNSYIKIKKLKTTLEQYKKLGNQLLNNVRKNNKLLYSVEKRL
jgi:DNA-binding transcriptional regulator GbsR (MarR family)